MKDTNTGKQLAASIRAFNAIRDARFPGLKSAQKSILYALASRLNSSTTNKRGEPYCWPSYDRLAGDAGMHRSTCIVVVSWLETNGFLVKTTRKTDCAASNSYTINVLKLEALSRKKQETPEETPIPSTIRPKPNALDPRERSGITLHEYQERYGRRSA